MLFQHNEEQHSSDKEAYSPRTLWGDNNGCPAVFVAGAVDVEVLASTVAAVATEFVVLLLVVSVMIS